MSGAGLRVGLNIHSQEVAARGNGGGTRFGAWRPHAPPVRSLPEHLAGDDVATWEPSFGHLWGIFCGWCLKQGCFPPDAL
jgi:hypothetical protein